MSLDYLTLNIKLDVESNTFSASGDVKESVRRDLVDSFLRMQIGAGKDDSEREERDVYNIQMRWYPADDTIEVSHDTGNKGLRDGILMYYMKTL